MRRRVETVWHRLAIIGAKRTLKFYHLKNYKDCKVEGPIGQHDAYISLAELRKLKQSLKLSSSIYITTFASSSVITGFFSNITPQTQLDEIGFVVIKGWRQETGGAFLCRPDRSPDGAPDGTVAPSGGLRRKLQRGPDRVLDGPDRSPDCPVG